MAADVGCADGALLTCLQGVHLGLCARACRRVRVRARVRVHECVRAPNYGPPSTSMPAKRRGGVTHTHSHTRAGTMLHTHTHTHTHTGRGGVKTLVQCDGSDKMLALCKSGLVKDIQAHTVLADEEVFPFLRCRVRGPVVCVCVCMCPAPILKEGGKRPRERERERETMRE